MRNLKFRAWDDKQKYMAYQGAPDLETIQSFMFHFGDKELMLSTGRFDRNGKEIYEGDILRSPRYWDNIDYFDTNDFTYCYMEWLDSTGSVFYGFHEVSCHLNSAELEAEEYFGSCRVGCNVVANPHHYEVIGNIFENPEYLNDAELTDEDAQLLSEADA